MSAENSVTVNPIDTVLGDDKKRLNQMHAEYLQKRSDLETERKDTVFPKIKRLLIERLLKDSSYEKLKNFLEKELTSDNKTSWLDHIAWVISDAVMYHLPDEYPSCHVEPHVSSQDLRGYGYVISDHFIDDIIRFNPELYDIRFAFSVDDLADSSVILLFLPIPEKSAVQA
jgi:hypothetical protein